MDFEIQAIDFEKQHGWSNRVIIWWFTTILPLVLPENFIHQVESQKKNIGKYKHEHGRGLTKKKIIERVILELKNNSKFNGNGQKI